MVTKLRGGCVKELHRIEKNYSSEVQKTNSLVSPYIGICEFIIIRSFTDFHKTKEAAELLVTNFKKNSSSFVTLLAQKKIKPLGDFLFKINNLGLP